MPLLISKSYDLNLQRFSKLFRFCLSASLIISRDAVVTRSESTQYLFFFVSLVDGFFVLGENTVTVPTGTFTGDYCIFLDNLAYKKSC